MDISITNNSTETASLYKKQTDADTLQKNLEKQGEVPTEQRIGESRPIDKTNEEKQGRIDFYA